MKITKSCYAVLGFGYVPPWIINAGFIIGGNKTLIVDTGPSYFAAQTIYGYAHNLKPGNEIIVVNTEKHLDHIAGNCFFKEMNCSIYGSGGINRTIDDLEDDIREWNDSILNVKRRHLREEKIFFENTKIVNPDKTINDDFIFNLGDVQAKIFSTPGHTATNISVYVEEERVLYTGDCMINKYLPNLEAGGVSDWKIWLRSLEKISGMKLKFVVPGHGNVLTADEIPSAIDRIKTILEEAIASGLPPTQEEKL